jgi:hypothetical protein
MKIKIKRRLKNTKGRIPIIHLKIQYTKAVTRFGTSTSELTQKFCSHAPSEEFIKSTYYFRRVRLSVRMKQRGYHQIDLRDGLY